MKLPASILENTPTSRFHPIFFRRAPMPSGYDRGRELQRFRSLGHHTEGFDTLDEARTWINGQENLEDAGKCWAWNGEGTPAMVEWFIVSNPIETE